MIRQSDDKHASISGPVFSSSKIGQFLNRVRKATKKSYFNLRVGGKRLALRKK